MIHHLINVHNPQFAVEKLTENPNDASSNSGKDTTKKEYIESIKFKLFDNTAPYTAQKFRQLASGISGFGYAGTNLHRIIPDCVIQGGIVTFVDEEGNQKLYEQTFQGQTNHTDSQITSFA